MGDLFVSMVNRSISASWIVLAAILLRRIFRNAPKQITLTFWWIVALRLIIPFSIESAFSLIPSEQSILPDKLYGLGQMVNTGVDVIDRVVSPAVDAALTQRITVGQLASWTDGLAIVWLSGMMLLIIYGLLSYWRLVYRVNTAIKVKDNIYCSEYAKSPFVLGFRQPKIYLPFHLSEKILTHVIAHEQEHIYRSDHQIKASGFLLLSVYWFNPILWLAYVLLCRDIERACDEQVISKLQPEQRAEYAEALLSCSVPRRGVSACPIAFGEQGVKGRIINVLNYHKAGQGLILMAVVACAVVAVAFLTSPQRVTRSKIFNQEGYLITEQKQKDITLSIPKDVLPDSIYTDEGHAFEKNEVIVYQTDTTTIYLERICLSNESDEQLYFCFDCSYDLPETGTILVNTKQNENGSCSFDVRLNSRDLTHSAGVFTSAVTMRGTGPGEKFVFYVSTEACKAATGVMQINMCCNELSYIENK
ncbi:MAG: hypothetical protein IIX65_01900 [Lachnospiraceae bacterium]|nr:hypothetical protein [Lachnospiraceae bacterium]